MDTSKYDEKILDLNYQREIALKEMTGIYKKFIEATVDYTRTWSKKQIEKYIGLNHRLTLSRNEKDLINMKKHCIDLIDETPSFVDKNLNSKEYWVHMLAENDLMEFYSKNKNYSHNLENIIKTPLSIIMGYSGKILIQFDYVSPNSQNRAWLVHNDRTIRYHERKVELNEEMKKYLNEYSEKSNELKEIIEKIKIAMDDKEKFKAINRWKQIEIN